MCAVSNLIDQRRDHFAPIVQPWPAPAVSKEEHEALKRDLEELKKEIRSAQEADKKMGLADCEMEEKVDFLKKVAEILEVDLEDVWPSE